MIDIKVPTVGESITEVTLVKWLKKDGDYVNRDEVLCEMESEKATFELPAEKAGILHIVATEQSTLLIGALACRIDETAPQPEVAKERIAIAPTEVKAPRQASTNTPPATEIKATPVAQAIMEDKKVKPEQIKQHSGSRIRKQDVIDALQNKNSTPAQNARTDRHEKMSNLRKTVSRRLVEAKNSTAMLTTFNEVDMSRILEIRKKHKDNFKAAHQVNLGFMSFFTKACCIALSEWPAVNARIDGDEIIYHEYCDISIAVSAPKGLVVPVIRNAEKLSMAEIETKVAELAGKARDNKLTLEEMSGGTFTITNGGVFGSLMSTPIINIPQSAILGMHKIQERPIALNGKVEIRPMMYLALSYDHRIIDGRESVSFLVRVKELLEQPEMLLLGTDPVAALLDL
jgi:2-oxoglutarate dehydrogenase E2 component (dihydrolipoamide succinyltransferase)